jgi:hypothetical protein
MKRNPDRDSQHGMRAGKMNFVFFFIILPKWAGNIAVSAASMFCVK